MPVSELGTQIRYRETYSSRCMSKVGSGSSSPKEIMSQDCSMKGIGSSVVSPFDMLLLISGPRLRGLSEACLPGRFAWKPVGGVGP